MPIPTGAPITAPPHDWIISATPWDQQVVILCDGSYRGPGADRASGHGGAAAIAYAAGVEVGRTCVTLPTCGSAVEAEAHGISLALALAQRHRRWGPVLIAGDCAATINHCAGRGRVRDPHALTILQAALERDGAAAIAAHWACINRADNEAADALAKASEAGGRAPERARHVHPVEVLGVQVGWDGRVLRDWCGGGGRACVFVAACVHLCRVGVSVAWSVSCAHRYLGWPPFLRAACLLRCRLWLQLPLGASCC